MPDLVDGAARSGVVAPDGNGMAQRLLTQENVKEALETAASNGFWDADGFDYRGEFEKLWGLK